MMRRRLPSSLRSFSSRTRSLRRQSVRQLAFDSLEDRRLLAGINVFVYDDANRSGSWESPSEYSIAEQVVYVDRDDDGRLNGDDPFAVTDTDGKALIENLSAGIALIRLLGSNAPAIPTMLSDSPLPVDVSLAGNSPVGNRAPVLGSLPSQTVDEDSSLNLSSSLFDGAVSDADGDPYWFFLVGKPTNGSLAWSIESGGSYHPRENFFGSDSLFLRVFDGKSWSSLVPLEITVNSVDDPPSAIEFAGGTIPENQPGFVVGPITIVDIDGGPNRIQLSPEDLYTIEDGRLKLAEQRGLDYEESATSAVTIQVMVGESEIPLLSQTTTLAVSDRNDLPSAIVFEGQPRVEEFVAGYEFGTIRVEDQDVGEEYDFLVSDDRFVVANGKFALKPGVALIFAEAPFVSVTVTAASRSNSTQISQTIDIEVVRASPPWQNKNWALDVNNDNQLTTVDVLVVINALNRMGYQQLDHLPPPGSATFVDVNGDRRLTPLDALILINALNRQGRELGEGPSPNGNGGVVQGEGEGIPIPVDDDGGLPATPRKANRRKI